MDTNTFGKHVKRLRESLNDRTKEHSVRKVAGRIGIEPSYLSKIERDESQPPGEETIRHLSQEIGEDPDILLAMAGKISSDLKNIITRRPATFAALLRELKEAPEHAILKVVRDIRDGEW